MALLQRMPKWHVNTCDKMQMYFIILVRLKQDYNYNSNNKKITHISLTSVTRLMKNNSISYHTTLS